MGNRQGLDQVQADKYLSAGYTIIAIDYRLAPQAKLPQIIQDLKMPIDGCARTDRSCSGLTRIVSPSSGLRPVDIWR